MKFMRWKAPLALLALLAVFALPVRAAAAPPGEPPRLTVRYFFTNACGACDEAGEFYRHFHELIGDAGEGVDVEVLTCNTFQTAENVKFRDVCQQYGIPEDERALPMVIVGGVWLSGREAIDARLREAFLAEKARLLARAGQADASTLLYFYVTPCDECAAVKEFMDTLDGSYAVTAGGRTVDSPLAVLSYNVAEPEGLELVRALFDRYAVPAEKQKAPVIFLRDSYLSGEDEIKGLLLEKIKNGDALGMEAPDAAAPPPALTAYEWPGIFLTGLINGFNPCSISLLLFLITLLLARSASILKLGAAFVLGKSVAYLALGTVLFGVLLTIDNSVFKLFQDAAKYVLLAVAVIVAAMNVSDFVAAKNEKYNRIRMQLPVSLRKFNHKWIQKLTGTASGPLLLPAVFALGLLVSVGEFLCTGQIYLATILYMIKRSPALDLQTAGAFLVYIAGMMIPLIALTLAVWKGREVFNLTELARRHMPLVKLLTAAVFLVFAAVLVFYL
jgi:hypothetical protein